MDKWQDLFEGCGDADIPPAYLFRQRLACHLRATLAVLKDPIFWRILAIAAVGWLAALIVSWEYDLAGWRRDFLRGLPILATSPFIVGLRKRHLAAAMKLHRHRSIEHIE